LDALRLLRERRAVPLAVAALKERGLELTALATLKDLGLDLHDVDVDAVVDLAKRNPSAEIVASAVRALTACRERAGISSAIRAGFDLAIAQVHGVTGISVRWQGYGPSAARDRQGLSEKHTALGQLLEGRVLFADGLEARVVLAPKDAAAKGMWFAH